MQAAPPNPDERTRVVVLGAGLTGLATSVELRRLGIPHAVLERDARLGGLASTAEEAGYRFDRTGHLLHLRDPQLRQQVLEWLGEGSCLEVQRSSAVFSHGVYTRYPFQANVYGLPKEVAYACVRDFVLAQQQAGQAAPKTFAEYCEQAFGKAISDAFMVPYNEKLWGVHPRELDTTWCERFVVRPTLDDVLRGAFGVQPPELGYNSHFLFPRLGSGQLVDALAERATTITRSAEIVEINVGLRRVRTTDRSFPYESLVSSLPLDRLLALMSDLPQAVRTAASDLRCVPLQYLDLALNTPVENKYHWVYVPDPAVSFYRVGSYSNLSAAMSPPNKGSLYVELATREPLALADILPRVAAELTAMNMIRAPEAIRFARLRRIEHAYVLFDKKRQAALDVIEPYLKSNGILSTGRYGRWTYASMEDALVDGREAAAFASARLGQS